eukprot:COSAG01_NODE_8444_length_2783_cov_3.777198_4_plen_278_part_00
MDIGAETGLLSQCPLYYNIHPRHRVLLVAEAVSSQATHPSGSGVESRLAVMCFRSAGPCRAVHSDDAHLRVVAAVVIRLKCLQGLDDRPFRRPVVFPASHERHAVRTGHRQRLSRLICVVPVQLSLVHCNDFLEVLVENFHLQRSSIHPLVRYDGLHPSARPYMRPKEAAGKAAPAATHVWVDLLDEAGGRIPLLGPPRLSSCRVQTRIAEKRYMWVAGSDAQQNTTLCASSTPGASTDLLYSTMNRLAEAAIVLGGGRRGLLCGAPVFRRGLGTDL